MSRDHACRWVLVALLGVAAVPATQSAPLVNKMLGAAASRQDKAAAPEPSISERRAEIDKQLVVAQDAVEQERAGKYPIPAGATPSQVAELSWLLGRIPQALQAQLDLLREIEAARAGRTAAADALQSWKGLDEPGPYSLTQLDRALDQLDAERTRLHSFQSVGELQREELFRVETQLRANQADERLALEKAADGIVAPLELARLRTRRTSELLQLLRMQGELNTELIAAAQSRAALLERQAAAVSANYRFSAQELDRVLKGLQSQQLALDKRIENAADARSRSLQERDQVRRLLAEMAPAQTVAEVRHHAEQQTRLEAANATLEALRTEQSALTTLRGLVPLATEAWRQRYTALSDPDPEARRMAEKALDASLARVTTLKSYAADLNSLADSGLRNQQGRVDALDENAPGRRYELAALDATRRAAEAVGEVEALAQRLVAAQDRWKQQYADAAKQRPAEQRVAEFWVGTKDVARTVWDFELFAVEDTVELGGKPVTLARGVTIGKSVGALLIFVFGYMLARALARRGESLMVSRFSVAESQARLLRRWLMVMIGFVLAVITLNLARIPLTVFAFFGGALAIGVGFGTQTLMKNFISGIIVLFERKVRVGDIVDVDGVRASAPSVEVNTRSSIIRSSDDIETMIPNSLLSRKPGDQLDRASADDAPQSSRVGVAYGAHPPKVARDPAPQPRDRTTAWC